MNKNKKVIKTAAAGLAVLMAGSSCCGNTVIVHAAYTGSKEETVYVKADADGSVSDVIVSDWLKNTEKAQQIQDKSELKDVQNVKGEETFTQNGSDLLWQAEGKDIYYQGKTEKPLPVEIKVSYYLNGESITPEKLAGQSGKVKIHFDYINKEKTGEVYVPFTMITGMILPADTFTNVEVTNGKIISDGTKSIVVGIGMPGLEDSLKTGDEKLTENMNIPDSFELTADVNDFSLAMTATVASTLDLREYGLDDIESLDDWKASMKELEDASSKLVDGSRELAEGLTTLKDSGVTLTDGMHTVDEKMGELAEGIGTLDSKKGEFIRGLNQLANGLHTLNTKKKELTDGVDQLASGLNTLNTKKKDFTDGVKKLANGLNTLDTKKKDLTDGINQLAGGLSKMNTEKEALVHGFITLSTGLNQLNQAVNLDQEGGLAVSVARLQAGASSLKEGVTQYTNGATELSSGVEDYTAGVDRLASGVENYVPGAQSLAQNLQKLNQQLNQQTGEDNTHSEAETAESNIRQSAKSARGYSDDIATAMEAADTTISVLSLSIEQNQAVLDSLQDVQSKLGAVPGDLVSKFSDSYGTYTAVLATDISYLQNDIEIQKKTLEAWNTFKTSADLTALNQNLSSIENQAKTMKAGESTGGTATAEDTLQSVKKSVAGLAQASLPLSDAATVATITKGAETLAGKSSALTKGTKDLTDKNATLTQGAEALSNGLSALHEGVNGQNGLADGIDSAAAGGTRLQEGATALSEALEQLSVGGTKLQTGAGEFGTGIHDLAAGGTKLQTGTGELSKGIGGLAAGSTKLQIGAGALSKGIGDLAAGGTKLQAGAGTLSEGIGKLANGSHLLKDGTKELSAGGEKLKEGVGKLKDGGDALQEGMTKFDKEGIQNLSDIINGDLQELIDRMDALMDAGEAYQTFAGVPEAGSGTVKFIIETGSIEK